MIYNWITDNYLEIFGAITGILYVFLEIRQTLWLWPVGIITSAVYVWVFFTGKLYADMSLQGYYLVISVLGWYWWAKDKRGRLIEESEREGENQKENREGELIVTRLKFRTGIILLLVFVLLYFLIWFILSHFTDSPVPGWDSFITSMSIVATWMLARKIYEHWYLWIVVNFVGATLFLMRGLYPTVILYVVYGIMSFFGLAAWKKTIINKQSADVVKY
jgi:nicotinamide mononucleotide transporter